MERVTITKEEINRKFERYFVQTLFLICLVAFLTPESVSRGRLSFAAFLMLVIYVPALTYIYLSLFGKRELVSRFEKRFIGINILLVLGIAVGLMLLGHQAYFMVGTLFYQITGVISLVLGVVLWLRKQIYLPLIVYALLSAMAWPILIDKAPLIWFVIFAFTFLLFVRQTSVLFTFNQDLKRSGLLP